MNFSTVIVRKLVIVVAWPFGNPQRVEAVQNGNQHVTPPICLHLDPRLDYVYWL